MKRNEIIVRYGGHPLESTKELLAAARVEELIGSRNARIGIKPNLILPSPASEGATTHPEIVAGVIEYLREHGFENIAILEGSWVGARTEDAFRECGYDDLARTYGVRLIDLQKDSHHPHDCAGMEIEICDEAMKIDFMFNIPVLKGHCQTLITGALKNGKGLIPNTEKRRFHALGLHAPIAHLNTRIRNDFIIVDGICGDLDFEEGGNPVHMDRIFTALDPVLCDAYIAELMGYAPAEIPYIAMAGGLGVGCADISTSVVRELNGPPAAGYAAVIPASATIMTTFTAAVATGTAGRKVALLEKHADPCQACSACYGSLIHALARLDETGDLDDLPGPICIGQGFRGRTGETGVGSCTAGFRSSIPGCPPSSREVLRFLQGIIRTGS